MNVSFVIHCKDADSPYVVVMITVNIVIYDNKLSDNHTDQKLGTANRLLGKC